VIDYSSILDKAGDLFLEEIARKFEQYDINATGKTLAGIKKQVTDDTLTITSDRPFPYTLQDGRGPAAQGSNSNGALLAALQEWLDAKGLDIPVWAVKNKINAEGTRLFRGDDPRFQKPTDVISAPTDAAVTLIREEVLKFVAIQVSSRIKRTYANSAG